MTVSEYIMKNNIDSFRIVSFMNWKTRVLYDTALTIYDVPSLLSESVVVGTYVLPNGIMEIEI